MAPEPFSSLARYLADRKALIDEVLNRFLPPCDTYPPIIYEAVRYSLFAGGKRIRPILCLAAAEATGKTAGGDLSAILQAACALEMIHTYSLIHDDLPALDNDDYRRGIPTSHKRFGEDIAILAGDALLTEAFKLLSDPGLSSSAKPEIRLEVINIIARAAGIGGMISGQVMDMKAEALKPEPNLVYFIHQKKTAELIRASVHTGAILAGAPAEELLALLKYGGKIGLCFQIADDILNAAGDEALLGKAAGSDLARGKATFPAVFGLEESRRMAETLVREAIESLGAFDFQAEPLRGIASFILTRKS